MSNFSVIHVKKRDFFFRSLLSSVNILYIKCRSKWDSDVKGISLKVRKSNLIFNFKFMKQSIAQALLKYFRLFKAIM